MSFIHFTIHYRGVQYKVQYLGECFILGFTRVLGRAYLGETRVCSPKYCTWEKRGSYLGVLGRAKFSDFEALPSTVLGRYLGARFAPQAKNLGYLYSIVLFMDYLWYNITCKFKDCFICNFIM